MIKMLFATKTVGKVEGFIYSLEDFLKKYKNTYTINDLRSAKFHVVYNGFCNYCSQEQEVITTNRKQLYEHLNSDTATCNRCSIFQFTLERVLGRRFGLNANIEKYSKPESTSKYFSGKRYIAMDLTSCASLCRKEFKIYGENYH